MNPKLILAFAGGMVLASGMMYLGMKRLEQRAVGQPARRPVPEARAQQPPEAPAIKKARDRAPTQVAERRVAETPKPAPKLFAKLISRDVPPPRPVHVPKPSAMRILVADRQSDPPAIELQVDPPPRIEAVSNPAVVPEPLDAPDPGPPPPHSVTLKAGAKLKVRIGETLSAERNKPGDRFLATLEEPLVIDGFEIAERGTRMEGEVVTSDRPSRANGNSHLVVRLVQFESTDRQNVPIKTKTFSKQGDSFGARDAGTVVATTALGAAIGAIAGGGKGAGIGAAVGGVAGTAGVIASKSPAATIPVETRISFEIQDAVTITERLN